MQDPNHRRDRDEKNCNYNGVTPYRHWTTQQTSNILICSSMFGDLDPESGLGSWGNPESDVLIEDGALIFIAHPGLSSATPPPHTPRRNPTPLPFTYEVKPD